MCEPLVYSAQVLHVCGVVHMAFSSGSHFLNYNEKKLPSAGDDFHFNFVAHLTLNCQARGALITTLTPRGSFKFWQSENDA